MTGRPFLTPLLFALMIGVAWLGRGHAQDGPRATSAEAPLPPDIDPASRYRLPLPRREDMANDQDRQIFDDLTKDRRPVLWLYSPKLAKAMEDAHHYVRFETGLDPRLTEIAVLTTARALNSQVEWTEWEEQARPGRPSAVEPAIIDLIKYCKPVVGLGPKETLIITYGRELFGPGQAVSSRTFAQAVALLGRRGVLDLTDLMGLYQVTATELKAYDGHLHAGETPLQDTPACARA
jgi:4-carboxymuconolactone decarboxylase